MTEPVEVPLDTYRELPVDRMRRRAAEFLEEMKRRRSVRRFSDRPVPREIIEDCLRAAGTAPSGANLQPWRFVAVSNPGLKRQIREAAEEEERRFYEELAPQEWLDALAPLATGPEKPFLETAPYLIAVFVERYGPREGSRHEKRYYAVESVGIATGVLITAVHHAGLVSLTYTPSRMSRLNEILARADNERPFLVLVVGYPADDATVPVLEKKPLEEIAAFIE